MKLPGITWAIFAVWLVVVLAFYLGYGRRNAILNTYTGARGDRGAARG